MANLPCAGIQNHREVRDGSRLLVWAAGSEGLPLAKTGNRGEGAGLCEEGDELGLGCAVLEHRVAQMEMVGTHWSTGRESPQLRGRVGATGTDLGVIPYIGGG